LQIKSYSNDVKCHVKILIEEDSVPKKNAAKAKTAKVKAKGTKKRFKEAPVGSGAAINEQDPKRRLGNFSGAGEHPRQGGRTSGIVGQTKQRARTDKKKVKK
jgi:hypothetical protein